MADVKALISKARSLPSVVWARRRERQVVVLVGVIVVLVVGLVGWLVTAGDDDDVEVVEPPPTTEAPTTTEATTTTAPTTTTTTTTPSPWTPEQQEVIDAYEAAIEASHAASEIPDSEHPDLTATHTGEELDSRVLEIEILESNERIRRFPEDSVYEKEILSVTFDEVEGTDVAYVDTCTVTDDEEVSGRTGNVLPNLGGVRTIEARNTMHNVDGTWKFALIEGEREEGLALCALDWE